METCHVSGEIQPGSSVMSTGELTELISPALKHSWSLKPSLEPDMEVHLHDHS